MLRILIILLILFPVTWNQAGLKVEPVGALTEVGVAESIRISLETKGLRVNGESGKPICQVWFRKELVTEAREVPGAVYPQIPEGAFIGVIHFPEPSTDFRGQTIKTGFYTLRYALILEDGNHQGVSPTKDFVLLCPVADDKDPNAKIAIEPLLKLSRTAAGSGHPSPWSLVPVSDDKGLPKAIKNEHDHIILETKITTKTGPLAIGLVVFGKTEG